MSQYGRIWQEIREVRVELAAVLGIDVDELTHLHQSILLVNVLEAERTKKIAALLSSWADLERRAADLDPNTGDPR